MPLKIPKYVLSERYIKLPFKKKLAVRRGLERVAHQLAAKSGKLIYEFDELNASILHEKIADKPKIPIQQLKTKLSALQTAHKALASSMARFNERALKYFYEFKPSAQGSSGNRNPLVQRMHYADNNCEYLSRYLEEAQKDLTIIEKRISDKI